MSFTLSSAIEELQRKTETIGEDITDTDFIDAFNDADSYFRSNYKMPTTEREYDLLVFPGVKEYATPSDFLAFMPPRRPYALDQSSFQHTTADQFVHYNNGKRTAFKFNRETLYFLVEDGSGSSSKIHTCDSVTDNGTWSISGDGASLAADENMYVEGASSLRFIVTGSGGTTTLVNSTLDAVDLTDYVSHGYLFLDLQCPSSNTADLTSVRLRIGSDASNYYEITSTARFRGDALKPGWGQVGFNFADKTTTGTPDDDSLDYIQLVITHGTSGINGTYRIDNIFAALPTYYTLPYYSNANFKTNSNTYISRATATTDTVLCPPGTDDVYRFKALEYVSVFKLQDSGLANYAQKELAVRERAMKATYPNQEVQVSQSYYKRTK